ncbi:MAG: TolC family protein [Sediminibacterium sp.]|nr:TolC family protein [Sediminibacterium sp.]
MRYFVIVTCALQMCAQVVFCPNVKAQNPTILTLEDALYFASKQSKQILLDSIQYKTAISKQQQGKHLRIPAIYSNLSYIRISDNITPFQVSFPSGDVVLNPQILNQSYNVAGASQLLWSAGKVKASIEMLGLETMASTLNMEKTQMDVSLSITTLWYNLYTLQQTRKIVDTNIQLLKEQKKDTENAVKEGILLQNEVLKIELAIAGMESNLAEVSSNLKILGYNISILTGLNPEQEVKTPDILPTLKYDKTELNEAIPIALKNRAELKEFDIRIQQAVLATKIARSGYFPTISAGGAYNYDRPNQRLFPNQATFTGTWNIGIFLNWNITGLYTTKEKIQESKLNNARISIAKEAAADGIRMEINSHLNVYTQTLERIKIAEKALVQATENFRVEQNKFQVNTINATDFLNANTLLLQCKINLTAALAAADLAYQKLFLSIN